MTTEASPACLWCGKPFKPRRGGGSQQTFCRADCRHRFHRSARQWAERAVAARILTVADLRNGDPAAYTLVEGGKSPAPVPEEGNAAALLDELLSALPDEVLTEVLPDDTLDRIIVYLNEPLP